MQIILYRNNSENNKIGKSLTQLNTVNGTLRDRTSILTPTLEINSNSVINANYCYIPDFGRYYFITDIESVKRELWGVSMKVDVLETYKQQIYNNEAILSRQENLYNLYLKDDYLNFTSDTFTLYKEFPNNNFKNDTFILMTNG